MTRHVRPTQLKIAELSSSVIGSTPSESPNSTTGPRDSHRSVLPSSDSTVTLGPSRWLTTDALGSVPTSNDPPPANPWAAAMNSGANVSPVATPGRGSATATADAPFGNFASAALVAVSGSHALDPPPARRT